VARYLVTGGAGFIGSNLVSALVRAGEKVRVLDNLATGYWDNLEDLAGSTAVECITGDIRDPEVLQQACAGIEVIFHEAGLGSVPRSIDDPVESDSVNCGGTVRVLFAAHRAGVRRVIFAASSSAYGDTPTLPKREDMPPNPLSPYAVSKLASEHYLEVFSRVYGLETVGLRYFNVFGPRQRPDGAYAAAIPRFAWAALTGARPVIFGDGETTRDFCFVENTVSANLLAAQSPRALRGEIANVAGGRRVSLNALVRELGRVLGRDVEVDHAAPRAGDVRDSLADVSRARELFGYEPLCTWEQGLPSTVAYLRDLAKERGVACVA
jgi:UDP-glucose 4-epimerase